MKNQANVKDYTVSQNVHQKLSCIGIRAPCRITVATSKGRVTLSGTIQYEHQRQAAVRSVKGVVGVQSVDDQMRVLPSVQYWKPNQR